MFKFKNGDYVIVAKKYLAEIVGYYDRLYIVKWYDKPDWENQWSTTVVHSDYIRLSTEEEIKSHFNKQIPEVQNA